MSEQMSINGKVDYWHLPYDEEGAYTFCNNCKETCSRITIEFHEGILDNWMMTKCPKCRKTIWVSKLKRKQIKDNKKCFICREPTNHYDCFCLQSGGSIKSKITKYLCSRKCSNKLDKMEEKKIKELKNG